MSVQTVNNPKIRKQFFDKIIEVLEHPLTLQISFAAYGVTINAKTFLEVANDLKAGFTETNPPTAQLDTYQKINRYKRKKGVIPPHINLIVLKNPAGSKWGEYGPSINLFRFNLSNSPNSQVWAVTVIHEAVHAWVDIKMMGGVEWLKNEAIAYIAEHIFGIYTGITFAIQVDAEKRDIHTTARLIARAIAIGKIPPPEWCEELINHLKVFYKIA